MILSFEEITITISSPLTLSALSKLTSGKIICSFTPKVKFPNLSKPLVDKPLKSLIRGKAIFTSLSKNSYILFFLKVTFKPAFDPLRVLKFETDFLNLVVTGFCPVIFAKSSSQDYHIILNFPTNTKPKYITTFSILGPI